MDEHEERPSESEHGRSERETEARGQGESERSGIARPRPSADRPPREAVSDREQLRENVELEILTERDELSVGARRAAAADAVARVGAMPEAEQVGFLRSLLDDPNLADDFREDPKGFAVEHGVLLDPNIVRDVVNTVIFDAAIDPAFADRVGAAGIKDLLDIRNPTGPHAVPAAVAAGAAVVMAAAAVVTMVVTLVRVDRPSDLFALKGMNRLGGGRPIGPGGRPIDPGLGGPRGPGGPGPDTPMGPGGGLRGPRA